jgi:hypothetical protein
MIGAESTTRANSLVPQLASWIGCLILLWAATGCTTPETCAELATCGGDLLAGQSDKVWILSGACTNQLASAPVIPSLVSQPPTLGGEAPPRRTDTDWCSRMTMKPDKSISFIQPWYPELPIKSGTVEYKNDGTYSGSLTAGGPQELDLAAGCFATQGFKIVTEGTSTTVDTLTCSDFTKALANNAGGVQSQANVSEVNCVGDGSGGCACTYNLLLYYGETGKYVVTGNVVEHYDDGIANRPVSSANFCANGDSLQLSGYKRTFLFNIQGVRSLVLSGADTAADASGPAAAN